jgi:hypothetical protein
MFLTFYQLFYDTRCNCFLISAASRVNPEKFPGNRQLAIFFSSASFYRNMIENFEKIERPRPKAYLGAIFGGKH